MATLVTSKGQVTIPKPVRDLLGIRKGDAVHFEVTSEGRVEVIKAGDARPPSRFAAIRGVAGPGMSTDELMTLLRGE